MPNLPRIPRTVRRRDRAPQRPAERSEPQFVEIAAAGLPLWWLVRYATGKVFTTAPTLRQVKTFWKDIAVARLGGPVKQLLPEPTATGLELGTSRYAFGASSSAGVNIQGLHGSNVLIIADEAPGIDADIWDAIEGIRAGGNVWAAGI